MWRLCIAASLVGLALAACGSSHSHSSSSEPAANAPGRHPLGPCAASQLRLSYAGTQGATGHLEVTLALRNTSGRPCLLRGYPAARLLNKRGVALPLTTRRGGGFFPDAQRRPRVVVLAPGQRARFGLSFVTNNEFAGARTCRTAAAAMSSAPGAGGHWWRLSLSGAPRISPCGGQLVVSPVYA